MAQATSRDTASFLLGQVGGGTGEESGQYIELLSTG